MIEKLTGSEANALVQGRPLPAPDGVNAEYWEGLARGELRYQWCARCERPQFYPRPLCTTCGGDPEWRTSAGLGRIHTYTVIRQSGARPFAALTPYVVAMVELDEGFQMMGNVLAEPAAVSIGHAVRCVVAVGDDTSVLPFWKIVS